MRILFLTNDGRGLGIAQKLSNGNHSVSFFINDSKYKNIGEGMIDKIRSNFVINEGLTDKMIEEKEPELVIFGTSGMGRSTKQFKKRGIAAFGGNLSVDLIEKKGKYMKQLLEIAEVKRSERGSEVICGYFRNGVNIFYPHLIFEERRFMNGDVGSEVECQGSIVMGIKKDCRLMMEEVSKVEGMLKRGNHRGMVYLKCRVDGNNLYINSFNLSISYDAIYAFCELYKGSLAQLFQSIAIGSSPLGRLLEQTAISIRISIPPYPNTCLNSDSVEIRGLNDQNSKHIWLNDVMLNKEGVRSAKTSGVIGAVTARGNGFMDRDGCVRRAYRTINRLPINNLQYRTDIGKRARFDFEKIWKSGWLK